MTPEAFKEARLTLRLNQSTQGNETMTSQEIQDAITDLLEVRGEISRVNRAAGHTVFNPAATQALDALIESMKEAAE